jgi:hypothetical protein
MVNPTKPTRTAALAKKAIYLLRRTLSPVPPDEGGGGLTPSGSEGLSGNGCINSGGSAEGLSALGCAEGVNVVTGRPCSPVAAFSKTSLIAAANRWQSPSKLVSVIRKAFRRTSDFKSSGRSIARGIKAASTRNGITLISRLSLRKHGASYRRCGVWGASKEGRQQGKSLIGKQM